MKIAQVSPIFERVPPAAYGGTERVVSYLTEELVKQGHDVTLFASGDSTTRAQLVSVTDKSIRLDPQRQDWLIYLMMMLDQVSELAAAFDVVHFHTDFVHFPIAKLLNTAHITTLHGRLDFPELVPFYKHFSKMPLVSISNSQRAPLPDVLWTGTVYHGLPSEMYTFQPEAGDYFAFIGRISPEKGVDRAIDIALQCGVPLYIAAKVDHLDQAYFNQQIKPLLEHSLIEYVGEIADREKHELLGHARALLFPIDWPEPFGLVLIEAFSCGTPVIAYRHGAVPEIMEDGVTGFIVTNQEQAVQAAQRIDIIDRKRCREVFDRRFSVERMAENYLALYRRVMNSESPLAL
jgi:glycosyltransferase involved in cell wall biosynthesis